MNRKETAAHLLRLARTILAEDDDFEPDEKKVTRKNFDKALDITENTVEESFETLEAVVTDALKLEKFLKVLAEKVGGAKGVKKKEQARQILKVLSYIGKQAKDVVETNQAVAAYMRKIVNNLRGEVKVLDKATKAPAGGAAAPAAKKKPFSAPPAVNSPSHTQLMN